MTRKSFDLTIRAGTEWELFVSSSRRAWEERVVESTRVLVFGRHLGGGAVMAPEGRMLVCEAHCREAFVGFPESGPSVADLAHRHR